MLYFIIIHHFQMLPMGGTLCSLRLFSSFSSQVCKHEQAKKSVIHFSSRRSVARLGQSFLYEIIIYGVTLLSKPHVCGQAHAIHCALYIIPLFAWLHPIGLDLPPPPINLAPLPINLAPPHRPGSIPPIGLAPPPLLVWPYPPLSHIPSCH